MKGFRQFKVWEKSHALVRDVYEATATFPREEIFGLTAQMRRCATSSPSNIAEGAGRGGNKELAHFLTIAIGSASELEYQVLLAHDLCFLDDESHERLDRLVVEVKKMLSSLIAKVRADSRTANLTADC